MPLIAIEGTDGAGTTTIVKELGKIKELQGRKIITTHEPTDGPIGRHIHDLLTDPDLPKKIGEPLSIQYLLAMLFGADRYWHGQTFIKPALSHGHIVITDRYYLSSVIYQGEELARAMNQHMVKPLTTITLNISGETSVSRVQSRGSAISLFEQDKYTLHRRATEYAIQGYYRGYLVDAEGSVGSILTKVLDILHKELKGYTGP